MPFLLLLPFFFKIVNSIEHGAAIGFVTNLQVNLASSPLTVVMNISAFLLATFAIVTLVFAKNRYLRVLGILYVFVIFWFDSTLEQIMGRGLQFGPVGVLMFEKAAFAQNKDLAFSLTQFIPPALVGLKRMGMAFAIFAVFMLFNRYRFRGLFLFSIPLALIVGFMAQRVSGGEFVLLPSPVKIPVLAALYLQTPSIDEERQEVPFTPNVASSVQHILFVVDTSFLINLFLRIWASEMSTL